MSSAVPESVRRIARYDPVLAEEVERAFTRLVRAGQAMVWSQSHLERLVAAGSPSAVLELVVEAARAETDAPNVWAVTWTGKLGSGKGVQFRALAGAGENVPAPAEVSRSILGSVMAEGRPAWSDDAANDARFTAAHSVQAFALRSVGCVPLGEHGALYLHDPETPGRFGPDARARLTALCSLAAPFLTPRATRRPRPAEAVEGMVGASGPMQDLYRTIRAFAPMPWPALVLGETGTGKELVARALHVGSPRRRQPFVPVNCGAIPEELAESTLFGHERGAFTGADRRKEGLVERVGKGTLFLDEVGELSPRAQVKLLRLLQEGTFERVGGDRTLQFEGRVVAATLRPLDDPDGRDTFREDLFHRLAGCILHVPPLRDRRADIPELADHLLDRANKQVPGAPTLMLSDRSRQALKARPWPGNVRELENTLRGAFARAMASGAPCVEPEHLGTPGRSQSAGAEEDVDDLAAATEAFQRRKVTEALEACDGNRTRAAERLGVSRQWLHRLISRWDDR